MRARPFRLLGLPLLLLVGCAVPGAPSWQTLFDGRELGDFVATNFGGEGAVLVEDGRLVLEQGGPLTGVTWRGAALPGSDYEIELSAARLLGTDFFCGLTFPVGESHASLILGGWGGALCGLSSLDGQDAAENETQSFRGFETGRVYRIRVEVTAERVRAFVDDECIVDVAIAGRQVSTRPEVDPSKPLGIASFMTTAAIGPVRWRRLGVDPDVANRCRRKPAALRAACRDRPSGAVVLALPDLTGREVRLQSGIAARAHPRRPLWAFRSTSLCNIRVEKVSAAR